MRHAEMRHEDEIAAWLHFEREQLPWERRGGTRAVLSGASAAALHELGTIIPQRPTVTLAPGSTPRVAGIDVRRAALRDEDWGWLDIGALALPVTTPARTIVDLLLDGEEPSYLARAIREAIARGLADDAAILDAARHRKRRSLALEQRATALLESVA